MDEKERAILDAVALVMRKRLDDFDPASRSVAVPTRNGGEYISIPAPQIHNNVNPTPIVNEVGVPSVTVEVDMTQVASALDRSTALMARFAQSQDDTNEMLRQLLIVLSEQKRPVFKSYSTVEAPQITVRTPAALPAPAPTKRTLTIRHDDGTESTVYEE